MVVHDAAKIGDFFRRWRDGRGIAGEALVGGADQGEIARERQRKHHAAVAGLENIAAVVREQAAHHDVAALVETQARPGRG